jgi:hypothetical protein
VGVVAGSSGNGNGGIGPVSSRHLEKLAVPQLLQVSDMPQKHCNQGKRYSSNRVLRCQSVPCLFPYMEQKCRAVLRQMKTGHTQFL